MLYFRRYISVLIFLLALSLSEANAQISAYIVSKTNITCFGLSNGEVELSAYGGATPYEYAKLGESFVSNNIFKDLADGYQSFVIRDANQNTDTIGVNIMAPSALAYTDSLVSPNCPNDLTGGVLLDSVSGGTGNLSYKWSNELTFSTTNKSLRNVSAGTYFLKITDANACVWRDTFDLKAISDITTVPSVTNISCYQETDGKISLQVTGTSNTYSISWEGPNNFSSNSLSLTNLAQGYYSYKAIDDTTGCADSATLFVQRPAPLSVAVKTTRDILCYGDSSGLIVPQVTGGTKPYIYEWYGPNGYTSRASRVDDAVVGTYQLVLTDIQGCTDTLEASLNQPSRLLVADETKSISCFGKSDGYVKLTVNGGLKPYVYQWSNGSNASQITNVIAGDYDIVITDSNNCIYKNSFQVKTPQALDLDYTKSDISCFGKKDGRFTLIVTGGTFPFDYMIETPSGDTITKINNNNVIAGKYKVKITDDNSCIDSTVIEIKQPQNLSVLTNNTNPACFGLNGALATTVTGGVQPYNFQWLDSTGALYAATQNVVSADPGVYYLTVTDANRCKELDTVDIDEPSKLDIKLSSQVNPACLKDTTGQLVVSTSGGTSPYYYYLNKSLFNTSGMFSSLSTGKYIVTVEDNNKCQDQLSVEIENLDTIKPTPKLKDVTLYLDKNGSADLDLSDINNGSFDNCGLSSIVLSKSNFTCSDTGIQNVAITVTDLSGNFVIDTVQVTLRDTIKPELNLRNYSVYLDSNGVTTISPANLNNGSTDNCAIKSYTISKSNFNCQNLGINNIRFEAVDYAGNKSYDTVVVNVIDTLKPILRAKDITVYLNSSGTSTVNPLDVDNGSSDNCGITSRNLARNKFDCLNLGNNFVNYTIQDASGNKVTSLVRIRILDTIAPQVRTRQVVVYLNSFGFGVVDPEDVDSSSFDNCKISSMFLGQSVFTCTDLGINTNKLTVVDASGNRSSAVSTITVVDTILPKVVSRNPTIYLDFNGNGVLSVFDVDKGSSDNCSVAKSSISKDRFTCADLGVQKINYGVTDASGNLSTGEVSVTIKDTIAPEVVVQNNDVYLDETGQAIVTPAYFNRGTTDNCNINQQKLSQDTFTEIDLGNMVVLYSATDNSGNRGLEVLNFKVLDTIKPTARVDRQVRYLDANGQAQLKVQEIISGISDNITIDNITLSDSLFDCSSLGKSEISVRVTDVAGNKTTTPFYIEIYDTIKPVVKLKKAVLQIDTAGRAFLNADQVVDTIIENCSISQIYLSKIQFDFNAQGVNYVQVTVIDQSGNKSSVGDAEVVIELGDADLDSIPDYIESAEDFDGDGVPNYLDKDSDNDGILDVDENDGLSVLLDLDRDGLYNVYDLDSDGDGIYDVLEVDGYDVEPFDGLVGIGRVTVDGKNGVPVLANGGEGVEPIDTDNDNVFDFKDLDSDDDEISDAVERGNTLKPRDTDNDNTPDYRDLDSDEDGIPDKIETSYDTDLDNLPNYIDLDSDDDGIIDIIETDADFDADGVGNWIDLDSDNDGIQDIREGSSDFDMDGIGNWLDTDSDGDLILDSIEGLTMTDFDALPDFLDNDSDNDFISDSIEAIPVVGGLPADTDGDGVYDFRDLDSDDDGLSDDYEGSGDVDNDGIGNYRDPDSDNDDISDLVEGSGDLDGDGLPNNIDPDSDGDGIPDKIETYADFDGDNVPNCLDLDSDNDGLNDLIECGYYDTFGLGLIHRNDKLDSIDIHRDVDGDGFYNFQDLDSDGDGISDLDEGWLYSYDQNYDGIIDGPDSDGDGICDNVDNYGGAFGDYLDYPAPDSDYDGVADFEDFDSDDDGILDEVETINDQDFDFISNYLDEDSDGDKLLDKDETDADYDLDGIPNFLDIDSDGDGIHDSTELDGDFDNDGELNYLDFDSDNDGVSDKIEGQKDEDNNGVPDYLDPQIFVPEVFTPNNDGINEKLILTGLNNYPDASIKVFNQWGQIVYDSKGPYTNNWQGRGNSAANDANGITLSEGVYFYIVYYNRNDLPQFQKAPKKGNLYIKP